MYFGRLWRKCFSIPILTETSKNFNLHFQCRFEWTAKEWLNPKWVSSHTFQMKCNHVRRRRVKRSKQKIGLQNSIEEMRAYSSWWKNTHSRLNWSNFQQFFTSSELNGLRCMTNVWISSNFKQVFDRFAMWLFVTF